jgi:tetratricopeptide (TPR) repeat protein
VPQPASDPLSPTRLLQEDLLARIESRLKETPGAVELQVECAHLLAELGRGQDAAQVYGDALKVRQPRYPLTTRAYSILPFNGKTLPITVVLLVSPAWGNAPFRKYLDDQTFLTLQVIANFHDPGLSLPPHQLVINCISDADGSHVSLEAARALVAKSDAPCINLPEKVLATTRQSNAELLGAISGVRAPKIRTYPRAILTGKASASALQQDDFSFPLLVRAPGYHTGQHFLLVETPDQLIDAVASLPGDTISVIEFLDARGADGQLRKFRVMMINGQLYPAHAAVGKDWKIHFFSSTAPEFAEHREEDRKFLENMLRVLGPRTIDTLHRIREALELDYAGIDFSIDAQGKVVVFEANATMNVQPPPDDPMWAYRKASEKQIAEAIRALFFTKAFSPQGATKTSPTQVLREFMLGRLEAQLARAPDRVDLDIERARLLIEMERFDEAKEIYLAILAKNPTQVVALNNLGTLLRTMGFHKAALKVHQEVAALIPENCKARVNFANSLRECGELEEARTHYETALRTEPDNAGAHQGLAFVLKYLRDNEAAAKHWQAATKIRPSKLYTQGSEDAPRILLLSSPCGGNSPLTRFLNKKLFYTVAIVPDFHDASAPLPPHDLVINAIGDADHCATSLDAALPILAKTSRPIINHPDHIGPTGRADNARLLGQLEGVVTPKILSLPRESLAGPGGLAALEEHGLKFPLLVRTPGFHEGSHFVRVEKADEMPGVAGKLPGKTLMAIEYLDTRNDDGKIRKFRVMMIDGKLYPLHKAIAENWMIHYYTAEMGGSAEHRAEDAAYLEDMPGVLGARAMDALARIRDALGLEYAGADFSLGRNGEVLLFEANATMAVPTPDKDEKWDFRRGPVLRIQEAVRQMLFSRAGATISM